VKQVNGDDRYKAVGQTGREMMKNHGTGRCFSDGV
jgi:hypothetical protein